MSSLSESVKNFTEDNLLFSDKYLEYALDIAENVSSSSVNQKDFIDTVKQRFGTGSPFIILQTLTLLDIVVKNANHFLKLDVSSRSFVNALRKLEKLNNEKVTERICSTLTDWVKTNEFVGPEHDLIIEYQRELSSRKPVLTNMRDQSFLNESLPVAVTNGPSFTKRQSSVNYDNKFANDLKTAINMSLIDHVASTQAKANKSEQSNVVKALFDFTDVEDGELSFRMGDRISIIDDSQPYWWKGICDGRVGLFPSTFVGPKDSAVILEPDKEVKSSLEVLKIDEALLDKCLNILKSADIEALPGSDSSELLKMEEDCLKMGNLIEHEISSLDGFVDKCQIAHEQLLQAIRNYDHECQLEANRMLSFQESRSG
ncbi:hypothetical protein GJ496_011301 [Pomphorhynchus laevis]|nr:hypothetical protein GJ496_011301 [Pomphorhynchus laevis]